MNLAMTQGLMSLQQWGSVPHTPRIANCMLRYHKQMRTWATAAPPPPRPSQIADWKIGVGAVGALVCVFLLAAVVYLLWKRRSANKRRKVLILMTNALSSSCHLFVTMQHCVEATKVVVVCSSAVVLKSLLTLCLLQQLLL